MRRIKETQNAMETDWFLNIIENGDLCSTLFLLLVLCWIGGYSVASRPDLKRWGWRAAFGVMLSYSIFRGITHTPTTPEELLQILLRGLLAAAFVGSITRILLPALITVWSVTGGRIFAAIRNTLVAIRKQHRERKVSAKRRREESARARDFEEMAPEREQLQLEAERRECVARESVAIAIRRREDARSEVELFFNVNAPELKNRFTREMLDDYVSRYMGDDKAPELVEERAATLLKAIQQHLDKVVSPIRNLSFDQILAAFEARKNKIQQSTLDDNDKTTLLIQLDEEREAAVQQAIRDGVL